MENLTQYPLLIREILEKHSQIKLALENIKVYKFFPEGDRYLVFHPGWDKYHRVFGPAIAHRHY
jgi:hypothetical protein